MPLTYMLMKRVKLTHAQENKIMNRDQLLFQTLNAQCNDPLDLSKKLLNATAKEYSSDRKENFANNDFIKSIINFCNANPSDKIIRNCILSIGHISRLYNFFPQEAFDFVWKFRTNRELLYAVVRTASLYPQFIKQSDYEDVLCNLAKTPPKKQSISLLHFVMLNIFEHVSNDNFLNNLISIFNKYIEKNPNLYESKNAYPILIEKMKEKLTT